MKRVVMVMVVALMAAGCARNVAQDAHTGADGRYKGASKIKLKNNKGRASGIVTYPGGDRIDWKLVELPPDSRGTLEVELTWKAPRPGLDLAFDVYNEWGTKIGKVSPKKSGASKKRKKVDVVGDGAPGDKDARPVSGKVYIAVYASNRGDAGKYQLEVAYTPEVVSDAGPTTIRFEDLSVPSPPKLALVPAKCEPGSPDAGAAECFPPCPAKHDPKNPNCGLPPCDLAKPDRANGNCPITAFPECTGPDPTNPKCDTWVAPKPEPVPASINHIESSANLTTIRINLGSKHGVTAEWTGDIVDSSGKPLEGGHFTVYKVQDKVCFGKVKLKKQRIDQNKNVRLYPPGAEP